MREILLLLGMVAVAATNRNDYLNTYQQFRTAYANYSLNKNQYAKAPTFAHEEQLVVAAKAMLIERAKLWLGYWQVLAAEVGGNQGLKDTERTGLTEKLKKIQTELTEHQQTVASASSRIELNEQAETLNAQAQKFQGISYNTLSQLSQGRLRVAVRELKLFAENLKQATLVQIRETEVREAHLRGIEGAIQILGVQDEQVNKPIKTLEQYTKNNRAVQEYQDAVEIDLASYEQIKRGYDLLKELANGIEL